MFWILGGKASVTNFMNSEGVLRTAQAIPGLLNNLKRYKLNPKIVLENPKNLKSFKRRKKRETIFYYFFKIRREEKKKLFSYFAILGD